MRERDIRYTMRARLLGGACVAAMFGGIAAPAMAQEQTAPQSPGIEAGPVTDQVPGPEGEEDVIVIQGIRQNLQSAQARKRNADTVVDSITAEDIGSFPDKSVAEALQRVPGITVSRFAGANDTAHFSAEPSGVIIRGLPQVRSEFNGRDTFSANSSRGLSFADVSPELMAGVDVYKNQTAELIEGGIAGTINLRTRLPFDAKGRLINLYGEMNYGDLAEQGTPAFSGIVSDRFQTGIGELGFMINGAYSHVKTASQGIQYDRMGIFEGVFGPGLQYIPSGIFMRDNLYDRKRYGIAAATQWRSNDGSVEASLQFNRSQYDNSWRERSIYSSAYSIYGLATDYRETTQGIVAPLTGTEPFTFDDEGNFLTGWWSAPRPYVGEGDDNRGLGLNDRNQAFFNRCYAWEGCTVGQQRAPQLDTASNALRNKQWTQDIGANVRWNVSDRLGVRFDAQYVTSEVRNYNASVTTRTFADTFVDLSGKYPRLQIQPNRAENINLSANGLLNPNNYHYYAITDHTEDSEGEEIALRADADYDFDSDWLDALRVGVRYADRDQEVKWGAYNWANIANTWTNTQASYFNIDRPVYPAGNYETAGLPGKFFGGNQINQNQFVFFNMDRLESLGGLSSGLGRPTTGVGEYYPVCSGAGYRAGETITDDFGCYLPSEVLKFSERTWATYGMLKFGGPNAQLGGIGISGNIGVRAVWTRDETAGAFTFPIAFTADALRCVVGEVNGRPTYTAGCVTGPEEIAFNNGATILNDAREDHFHALPSFNLKLDLTDKLVARFAYSRAMSRPDVGLLRNFVTVTRVAPNLQNPQNPAITYGPDGVTPIGYDFEYRGQAGNPALKPITANQFDLTLEYYLTPTNSFTLTGFQKNFQNYIQVGSYNLNVTNNGVNRDVLVRGPINGDGAKIRGFEVAVQSFFDFLPAPLDGFGVQANYTFVDNQGIQTITLVSQNAGESAGGGVTLDSSAVQADALEGISKHSYNLVGMYEKGQVSARVAYNWRSRYLITAIDCCVGLPVFQDAQGFLDASIRYRVSDMFEISLQGSNLLGTDTVLRQQVDADGLLKPNAWFRNDRRFQLGVRLNY